MAIFNVEKYIERSFNSILNQTMDLNDIEVIMVDDKSTDDTRKIVAEYEKKYENFKAIYHKENSGGCAVPRNLGLKVATGEYVMFLDPDDEFALDMCETLYNRIINSDAQLVKCNHEFIYKNNSKIDYLFDKTVSEIEINCETEQPPNTVSVCNAIHNRNFLLKNNILFPELTNAEDSVFVMKEYFNAKKMIYINNYAGYKYYTNDEVSHQSEPSEKNLDGVIKGFIKTKEIIQKYNRTEIYSPFFSFYCYLFFMIIIAFKGDKKEYLKRFYEFEKSLNCTLSFKYSWMNLVNKILMKNRISTAIFVLNLLNLIRNTPIIEIYRYRKYTKL